MSGSGGGGGIGIWEAILAAAVVGCGGGLEEVERGREIGAGIGRPINGGGLGEVNKGTRSRLPIRVFKGGGGEGGGEADDWDERCGLDDAADGVGDGERWTGGKKALSGFESREGGGVCSKSRSRSETETCVTGAAGLSRAM